MKMVHRIFPSWVWLALVGANILFMLGSFALGTIEMVPLNGLSAAGCWIGYRLSKNEEENEN